MSDPLERLLQPLGLEATLFPPTSRYHGLGVRTLERASQPAATSGAEGADPVVYLERRFVPAPERFSDIGVHRIEEGDRLDLLAHRYLGDAEQFWRIADAHRELQPEELEQPVGRKLRITLPEGVPGTPQE